LRKLLAIFAVVAFAAVALANPFDLPMVPQGGSPMVLTCGPMIPGCGAMTDVPSAGASPPPLGCTADGKSDFSNPCDIAMFFATMGM
jgi:hypothetical protein